MVFAKVLTVSDGVAHGTRQDKSGLALVEFLTESSFEVVDHKITPDGFDEVSQVLVDLCDNFSGLIVTTGGTGFSARDVTPEATKRVCERIAPGFSEYMRAVNRLGILSRGISGIRGRCLILNTVGSSKGCVEMLGAVLEYIPHAIALMSDPHNPHPNNNDQE